MPRNIFQVTVNLPASFRNNVNNNEVFNPYVFVRNRLYHFVFHRFALQYARVFSDVHRKLIEFLILLASLFCFITLVYVHVVFVQTPMTCLDGYKDVWQRNGILRVEVLSGQKKENYTLQDSYWKEKTLRLQHFDGQSYYFYSEQTVKEESTAKDHSEDVIIIGNNLSLPSDILEVDDVFDKSMFLESVEEDESPKENEEEDLANDSEIEKVVEETNLQPILEESIIAADPDGAYIMEFSLEYGFLRLRPSKRRDLNISVTFVVLDPEVDACFGGSFNRFLLDNFLGYDNVLLASIKKMAEKKDQKGFVRNAVMDIEYIFINNWTNEKSYITAGFVMLIFTLTISTLLRHSHHQIFIVVVWPRNLIPSSGAPVLTVILALVGMEAVMSDFFHDRSIALYVIVIVWFADLYDAVCCQSALSKRHWFRFFYLYHFLFYAYNYKFGGVYWPLTLTTSWLFTLHSMVFFFHHYELPRFLHRAARVSAAHEAAARNPRQPRNNNNPPDNPTPPDHGPDQDEDNPPDDGSGGHATGGNESTPEPGDDADPESGNDRDGSADQSESTDQSGSTDRSGSTDQSGSADQSGSCDPSGSVGESGSKDQPGSKDSSGCTNCCSFPEVTSSLSQAIVTNEFKSEGESFWNNEPGCKKPIEFNDQSSSNAKESIVRNATEFIVGNAIESVARNAPKPNFGTRSSFPTGQYDSTDQMNSTNQLYYGDQPLSTKQLSNHEKQLSTGHTSSTDKSVFTDEFQTKDQLSSMDQISYKDPSGYTSLVPNSNASIYECHNMHQQRICTSISDTSAQPTADSFVVSDLSQKPQVCTRSAKDIESHDSKSFRNFSHEVLEKSQSFEDDVLVVLPKKKNLRFAGTLFPTSKTNSSYVRQETPFCFGIKQRFGVNVVEC